MLANVGAIIGFEGLEVAVQRVHHDLAQGPVFVAGQELVPLAAPQQLNDVPTRPAKFTFEFLNNLAVTTDGTIQTLQIAVDDKNQVI